MKVRVCDNTFDQALGGLKKNLQREDIFREMKLKQYFEKPSDKNDGTARLQRIDLSPKLQPNGAMEISTP